jgi:hypothetical protein
LLAAGATDVAALAAELNLLDLAGLSVGQVLRATGAASAAWGAILATDISLASWILGTAGQIIVTDNGDGTVTLSAPRVLKRIRIPMESFRKGATAPTERIKNSSAGYSFDTDAETVYISFCAPYDWDQASNIVLMLHCVLEQAETANDKIDWETIVTPIADHENILTAPTQTPGVEHDIQTDTADGDLHEVSIAIVYDDGTAPVVRGDNVLIRLSRTANVGNAGYVDDVLVIYCCILYYSISRGVAV